MPRKSGGKDLILFSSSDPRPLVEWLCETYGLQTILQSVAQYRPAAGAAPAPAPAKRAYKKRAPQKSGAKKSSKKGAKAGAKKGGGKKGGGKGRSASGGGAEVGNPG